MTQSPYSGAMSGQTVGQTLPASSDFGETTVSGTPVGPRHEAGAPAATPPAAAPTTALPTPGTPGLGASSAGAPTTAVPNVPPAAPSPAAVGAAGASRPGVGPAAKAAAKASNRARGPRRARLQLRHIDPWTVLKFSCVLSVALFFVWLIVVGVLYGVLDVAGVVQSVNDTVTTINGEGSREPITAGVVFGGAAIIGVVNVLLFIALSTIGAVVYNLCADLVGGIELTLSER